MFSEGLDFIFICVDKNYKMAEQVADKRANERQIKTRSDDVISLMDSMKWILEQALNALKIQGKERAIIAKQLP